MKLKTLLILVMLIICIFTLSGCYNSEGLEALAYVVALGIDKGENNKLRLTLQIATTNSDSGSGGGGSRKQSISKVYNHLC